MAHHSPSAWMLEARRRNEALRSRAESLEIAAGALAVAGMFAVALASATARDLLPWSIAVAPFPLAAVLATLARRTRRGLAARERGVGRLVEGSAAQPSGGVRRLRRLRLVPRHGRVRGSFPARAARGEGEQWGQDPRCSPNLRAQRRGR